MEKRILVTGTGRRVELMQAFRQAAGNLNINLKLIGADMAGTAPALAYCDYYRQVCAMRDADYIPQLLHICAEEHIDLVMPTIDTDLQVLADHREEFEAIGTQVMISAPDKIAICRDKNYTSDFFVSCGLLAPKPCNNYKDYDGPYPCFIKPKDGSSSINAFKVETAESLPAYAERVGDYIIQPFIDGTEYTIDIFCDFDGNPIYITPRIRLAVRSGEVLKTEIAMDEKIISEARALIESYKPCGPITVQLIRQESTGDDYYIEINPRYGGGAPLSMRAGAKSAEAVLKLLCGEKLSYTQETEDGAVYSRFDQCVCITGGSVRQKVKGVVFDLDDTLYPERAYVRNGYRECGKWLENKIKENTWANIDANKWNAESIEDVLWNAFLERKPAINVLVDEMEFAEEEKPSIKREILRVYRAQKPTASEISLYDGVIDVIDDLKSKGIHVGIITDGRVEGQNNKLDALGIREYVEDIIITDELGGEQFRKPCDIAFRIMQNRWGIPYEQMVYVGDNPKKDFMAPAQLGMQAVYMHNPEGLYYEGKREDLGLPVIESVTELIGVVKI